MHGVDDKKKSDNRIVLFWYSEEVSEVLDINWDDLGFGLTATDYMYVTKCSEHGMFKKGELQRFGNIEMNPSAGVLNYGQVSDTMEVHATFY